MEAEAPLTLGQKIKAGIKGFTKAMVNFAPRGLLITTLGFGAMALLVVATGFAPLAYLAAPEVFASRVAISMLIGGMFAGIAGAAQEIQKEATPHCNAQAEALQRCREQGPVRAQHVDHDMPTPPSGLPLGKPGNKQLTGYIGQ